MIKNAIALITIGIASAPVLGDATFAVFALVAGTAMIADELKEARRKNRRKARRDIAA